ncbi:MAG: hypothetical protein ACLUFN_09390 [Eubacterium sp.]
MKKSKQISLCGIITALSVALLFFGTVVWVMAYFMPLITGLLMIILTQNVNKKSAWTVYVSVSIICLLFMPDKECALTYTFFFGFYPIIKDSIDKIKSKILLWLVRLGIFNAGILSSQLICIYIFGIPFDDFLGKYGIVILIVLANAVYLIYEKLIQIVMVIYVKKYKNKVSKFLK